MCVCERERVCVCERERERVCVCVCGSNHTHTHDTISPLTPTPLGTGCAQVRAVVEYCRGRSEEPSPHLRVVAHEDDGRTGLLALAALKARDEGMSVTVMKSLEDGEDLQLLLRVLYEPYGVSTLDDFVAKAQESDVPVIVMFLDGFQNPFFRDQVGGECVCVFVGLAVCVREGVRERERECVCVSK